MEVVGQQAGVDMERADAVCRFSGYVYGGSVKFWAVRARSVGVRGRRVIYEDDPQVSPTLRC